MPAPPLSAIRQELLQRKFDMTSGHREVLRGYSSQRRSAQERPLSSLLKSRTLPRPISSHKHPAVQKHFMSTFRFFLLVHVKLVAGLCSGIWCKRVHSRLNIFTSNNSWEAGWVIQLHRTIRMVQKQSDRTVCLRINRRQWQE